MLRDQYLTIDLKIEDKFIRYSGNIYEQYNLFFIIKNQNPKHKIQDSRPETFQVTYNGKIKAEPLGKFAGGIELRKGKNEVMLIIKDMMGKELYKEKHIFDV